MENERDLLMEYHRRIGEIFLSPGQTPFRISKQIWKLHAEMAIRLTPLALDAACVPAGSGQAVDAAQVKHDG